MILRIATLLLLSDTREINVYESYGLVTVELLPDELVVTNGKQQFDVRLSYNSELSKEQIESCSFQNEKINIVPNQSSVKDSNMLNGTEVLRVEKERYENEFINSTNEFFRSHFFCNRGRLSCGKMPITGETLRSTKGVRVQYQLINCHGQTTGISEFCGKYVNEPAYCCSINIGDWEHASRPTDQDCGGIEHGAAMARVLIKANSHASFETEIGRTRATEIDRYCFYDPDRRFKRDLSNTDRNTVNDIVNNQNNLLKQILEVDDLSTEDFARELKSKESRVLAIDAYRDERAILLKQICGKSASQNQENNALIEASQSRMKTKIDSTLSTCESNIVPQIFSDNTLSIMCQAHSNSNICNTHLVRHLFSCTVLEPIFDVNTLIVRLTLTLNAPISETFTASTLYTLPMYISIDQYKKDINITHVAQKAEEIINSNAGSDLIALKNILTKVMSKNRRRRSIVSIYYKIELDDLPDIITKHETDIIAFNRQKCRQVQSTIICDFVQHSQQSSNCLNSIMRTETNNVEKICPFKITSSESDCQVVPTPFAQLITTNRQISVMRAGDEGIYHDQTDDHCNSVCAIPNTNYIKIFECGSRKYQTQIETEEHDIIEVIATKLDEHKIINTGTNLDELDRTGYQMIDRIILKNTNRHFDHITNLLVMAIVGVGTFTFGSRIAISSGFVLSRWIRKIKEKFIYRGGDESRARAHNVYLNLKKLQQKQKSKVMCA